MKPSTYTRQVEQILNHAARKQDRAKAEKTRLYLGTQLHVHGLVSKAQAEVCKAGFSFASNDKEFTFHLFDKVFKESPSHEGKNQALLYLDQHYKHISVKTQLRILPRWVNYVDNWAHSDYLSKFLTRLHEHPESKQQMRLLVNGWNTSARLWKRRQSLVSLFYYARTKKEYMDVETVKQLLANVLTDNAYFVQKAVGWTLRESYQVYPKQTYQLIEENIKLISPVAFTTCLEKMTEREKTALKQKRK